MIPLFMPRSKTRLQRVLATMERRFRRNLARIDRSLAASERMLEEMREARRLRQAAE